MGIRQLSCAPDGAQPLGSTMYFLNSLASEGLPFQVTQPLSKEKEFQFMNARWKDGSPLTFLFFSSYTPALHRNLPAEEGQ
mgnify:CR=1 FL=1